MTQSSIARPQRTVPAVGSSRHRRIASAGAIAGIVGPILFTVAFVVQGLVRAGEYDAMAEIVSALAAGPNGWVQDLNFIVFGLLTIAFATGLHIGIGPSRMGVVGPAILALTGVALLMNGTFFPLREDAAGVTYDPGGHFVFGLTYFLGSAIGLIVVSRRLARDPAWRSLSGYTLVAGITAIIGFLAMGALVMPDDAPFHDWAGLVQRVLVIAVLFPCTIVLAIRLWSRSNQADDHYVAGTAGSAPR